MERILDQSVSLIGPILINYFYELKFFKYFHFCGLKMAWEKLYVEFCSTNGFGHNSNFWVLTKYSIFYQNFEFSIFKLSIIGSKFDFTPKLWIFDFKNLRKINCCIDLFLDFLTKIQNFDQKFDLWTQFQFLTKRSILTKPWSKFRLFNENSEF